MELIYTAGGNRQYAEIAVKRGFTYGARLPDTVYFQPEFVDQEYKAPNRAAYMDALQQYRPRLATVLDLERSEQTHEVLDWAHEAAQYVREAVIIIPKVFNIIRILPHSISDKQVRLGYSVPTTYGGTPVPKREFAGWPLHLLGGSPQKQYKLAHERGWNVVSMDNNYIQKQANAGRFFHNGIVTGAKNKYFPTLREAGLGAIDKDVPSIALDLSLLNMHAMWLGCAAGIRYAKEADIDAIDRIARRWDAELGYVSKVSLRERIAARELFVAEKRGDVLGFCSWHARRDGWHTIREVAVHPAALGQHIGRALLESVPQPRRLKCTVDNARANGFYATSGGTLTRVEAGKQRALNVWEWGGVETVEQPLKEAA